MKFIHTADIHLGAKPDSTMPWGDERADELWDSFDRLLEEVRTSQTELLLIAGDLFHRQPLKRELKEVDYRLSQLENTRVVIIAGNHDCIGASSYYRDFEWSDNVVFFKKNHVSYIYLEELNTIVYGMSYDRNEISEDLYRGIRPMKRFKDGSLIPDSCHHILLVHGGDAQHIPVDMASLRMAGFDYVAMGHIHKPWIDDQAAIAYAGALEPIDRNDEGAHGFVRGTIDQEGTSIEFVPFAKRGYETLHFELGSDMAMGEIASLVSSAIARTGKQNMYKVMFSGFKAADLEIDERQLGKLGRIISITDQSMPDFDFERLYEDNQNNMIGLYIRKIAEMNISENLKAKALCYGMKALLMTDREVK